MLTFDRSLFPSLFSSSSSSLLYPTLTPSFLQLQRFSLGNYMQQWKQTQVTWPFFRIRSPLLITKNLSPSLPTTFSTYFITITLGSCLLPSLLIRWFIFIHNYVFSFLFPVSCFKKLISLILGILWDWCRKRSNGREGSTWSSQKFLDHLRVRN